MLRRPGIPPIPVIGYNQYKKVRDALETAYVREYREMMDRQLNPSAWKHVFMETIKTPEKREQTMSRLTRSQQEEYFHELKYPNTSGAPEDTGKGRIEREVWRYFKKLKRDNRKNLR